MCFSCPSLCCYCVSLGTSSYLLTERETRRLQTRLHILSASAVGSSDEIGPPSAVWTGHWLADTLFIPGAHHVHNMVCMNNPHYPVTLHKYEDQWALDTTLSYQSVKDSRPSKSIPLSPTMDHLKQLLGSNRAFPSPYAHSILSVRHHQVVRSRGPSLPFHHSRLTLDVSLP
jgi:hypothetical protein